MRIDDMDDYTVNLADAYQKGYEQGKKDAGKVVNLKVVLVQKMHKLWITTSKKCTLIVEVENER